jgi:hypothetical protein
LAWNREVINLLSRILAETSSFMVGDSYKNFAEHIKKALSYAQKDSDYVHVYIRANKYETNTIDDDIYYIVLKKSAGTGIYFPGKYNGMDE